MKKIFYILSAAVVVASACTRELNPDPVKSVRTTTVAPQEGDMMLVTFEVTVPETAIYATQTRAQHQIGDQPSIENGDLYVAVFGAESQAGSGKGGNLQHFLKARLISDPSTENPVGIDPPITHDLTDEDDATLLYKYAYEVLMPLSSQPLVLDFMVGACDNKGKLYTLENPLPVDYEASVMPKLFSINGNAAYWQRVVIPGVTPKMENGEYVMTDYVDYVDDDGQPVYHEDQDYVANPIEELHDVQLIRNFAKITYTAAADADFTLDGFYLVDTPVSGTLAPYSTANGYNTAYTSASSAGAILGAYQGYVLSQQLNSGITGKTFKTPGTQFEYMYERTIPSYSSPAFAESGALLKVTWKDIEKVEQALRGQTRYYKVSFVNETGYIPILRNIQYNFEVSDITADQHPTSEAAAYGGGFLGDVSANVSTAMLDEIGNHKSRIAVSEMSKTLIGKDLKYDIDFYFYPVDGNSEVVVTDGKTSTAANAKVTITTDILAESDYEQAVTSVSSVKVTPNTNGTDNHGTITVTLSDSEAGKVKRGKVRILGQVEGSRALYRDVIFTVMEKQAFTTVKTTTTDGEQTSTSTESSVTKLTSDAMGQEVTVTIQLPDELPRDIFPLQVKIEAENNGLYSIPNNSVTPAESALPVKYGVSAFNASKNNYYFVKTITFDDYATLNGVTYDYTNAFPCKFKTRLSSGNATRIKINDTGVNDEGEEVTAQYFVESTLSLTL